VRFRELQDLPLEVNEQVVGETPPERFIEIYDRVAADEEVIQILNLLNLAFPIRQVAKH
jgi:hypothetical protein